MMSWIGESLDKLISYSFFKFYISLTPHWKPFMSTIKWRTDFVLATLSLSLNTRLGCYWELAERKAPSVFNPKSLFSNGPLVYS